MLVDFFAASEYTTNGNTTKKLHLTKTEGIIPSAYIISYASIVEIVSVVSSSTSSNAFTVSNDVNIVTLYSVAV